MKKVQYHKSLSVLFKQWTRRACAVLVSLKTTVNIAVLDYSLSAILSDKKKSVLDFISEAIVTVDSQEEEDLDLNMFEQVLIPVFDNAGEYAGTVFTDLIYMPVQNCLSRAFLCSFLRLSYD